MNLRGFFGAEPLGKPANWVALPLRLVVGLIFVYYGADKLFLNGENTGMNAAFFQFMFPAFDLQTAQINQYAVGALEFVGGLSLLAGFMVKFFGFQLAASMVVAMLTAHDYRLEGALGAGAAALFLLGAGPLSLDRLLGALPLPRHLGRLLRADADPALFLNAGWGALPLRLAVGVLCILGNGLGLQKLFGEGPDMGVNLTPLMGTLGAVQVLAGVLVLAGLWTRPAALLLFLTLLVDLVQGGLLNKVYTYIGSGPLIVDALILIILGSGPLAIDWVAGRLGRLRPGPVGADVAVDYS